MYSVECCLCHSLSLSLSLSRPSRASHNPEPPFRANLREIYGLPMLKLPLHHSTILLLPSLCVCCMIFPVIEVPHSSEYSSQNVVCTSEHNAPHQLLLIVVSPASTYSTPKSPSALLAVSRRPTPLKRDVFTIYERQLAVLTSLCQAKNGLIVPSAIMSRKIILCSSDTTWFVASLVVADHPVGKQALADRLPQIDVCLQKMQEVFPERCTRI